MQERDYDEVMAGLRAILADTEEYAPYPQDDIRNQHFYYLVRAGYSAEEAKATIDSLIAMYDQLRDFMDEAWRTIKALVNQVTEALEGWEYLRDDPNWIYAPRHRDMRRPSQVMNRKPINIRARSAL